MEIEVEFMREKKTFEWIEGTKRNESRLSGDVVGKV
jgi:hypothetical protein